MLLKEIFVKPKLYLGFFLVAETSLFTQPIFVEIFGYLGVLGCAIWPLFRKRSSMLCMQAVGDFFFAAHYYFLEAGTAALMNLLGGIQAMLAIPLGESPKFKWLYIGTLPVIAFMALMTWQPPASIFSSLGFAIVSIGRYQLDTTKFRFYLLLALACWIIHNIIVGSIPGLIADSCILATSFWMYRKERSQSSTAS